jgi:hypothetical protein
MKFWKRKKGTNSGVAGPNAEEDSRTVYCNQPGHGAFGCASLSFLLVPSRVALLITSIEIYSQGSSLESDELRPRICSKFQLFFLMCVVVWHGNCRFAGNQTSTRKYSWWSFVPLALFVQYRRAAYWYFTAMAALSLTPFTPYSSISVWLPLIFVLVLGLLREAWEDVRRSRGDRELNNRPIEVHDGNGHLVEKTWKDIVVGDLVRVKDGEYFPADLLLISSTGPDGICYVETMNLDGETNLKVNQPRCFTLQSMAQF